MQQLSRHRWSRFFAAAMSWRRRGPMSRSGTWTGPVRSIAVSGGDCVGPAIAASGLGGAADTALVITQNAGTVSARESLNFFGGVCQFSGSVNGNVMTLSSSTCDALVSSFECPAGQFRDIGVVGETITLQLIFPVSRLAHADATRLCHRGGISEVGTYRTTFHEPSTDFFQT